MRILSPALVIATLLVPAALAADVIVMMDGRVFEVQGPIRFDGDFVTCKMTKTDQAITFRRFEVDENKTRGLNQVLDSDLHGLPRLRRVESIEAQRPRTQGRSIPMVAERPPIAKEKEVAKERDPATYAAKERVPVNYPAGDYPTTLQANRVSRDTIGREEANARMAARASAKEEAAAQRARAIQDVKNRRPTPEAEEEARAAREARREERRREREAARAAREEEDLRAREERDEARAAREAEALREREERAARRETARQEREMERSARSEAPAAAEAEEPAAPPKRSSGDEARAASYRQRIEVLENQLQDTRNEVRRLTDLQKDAEAEFEGQSLKSVDSEIDRLMRRMERLQERKDRLEERLTQLEE